MYRMVDTGTWDDPWFAELEPDAKLLFLYLLTNLRSTPAGAFEITLRAMAFETGLGGERIQALLSTFGDRVVWWSELQIVWLRNFYRRQNPNEKFTISARRVLASMPAEVRERVCDVYPELDQPSDTRPIPVPTGIDTHPLVTATVPVLEPAPAPAPPDAPPTPIRPAPKSSSPPSESGYEKTLNGAMPKLVAMCGQLDKQLTESWLRQTLAAAEKDIGPLPRDKIGKGLDLALDQMRRSLKAGKVESPRGLCRKFVFDYLREQASV